MDDDQMMRPFLPEPYWGIFLVFTLVTCVVGLCFLLGDHLALTYRETCAGCGEVIHDDVQLFGGDDESWHRECLIPQIDDERDALLAQRAEDYEDMGTETLLSLAMRRIFPGDTRTQVMAWRVVRADSQPDRLALNEMFFVDADDHTIDEAFVIGAVLAAPMARHDLLVAALTYGDAVEATDELHHREVA